MESLDFITPKVRNKTSYEAPSTSGTPRNVPYTILTHSHIYIIIVCVYSCLELGRLWLCMCHL